MNVSTHDVVHDSVNPRAAPDYFATQTRELARAVDIDAVRVMQDLVRGDEGQSHICSELSTDSGACLPTTHQSIKIHL